MKTVRKLKARFTNVLDGFSVVNTDLEPIHEDAVTFNFPLSQGCHAEVRFSIQDEHVEKPYADFSPSRKATENEVLDSIELLYQMIATGGQAEVVNDVGDEGNRQCPATR
ncbi:MAG: hypothetical protein ACPG32_04485 [Akkermansiaceae bacterium]